MGPRNWKASRAGARAGFTLLELLMVMAVASVIATITIPRLLDARRMAQESSAVQTCRAIQDAQGRFLTKFGRYAYSLDELCGAGLVFAPFGVGLGFAQVKSGYEFGTVIPMDTMSMSGGWNPSTRFRVFAQPHGPDAATRLANGERQFFLLETGFLYEDISLNDVAMGYAFAVAQYSADTDFGTTYPAVPDF